MISEEDDLVSNALKAHAEVTKGQDYEESKDKFYYHIPQPMMPFM